MKNSYKTAEEMRAVLKAFVNDESVPSTEREKFWDILTGTRGPDEEAARAAYKDSTTAIIRYAVFGPDSALENFADSYADSKGAAEARKRMLRDDAVGSHFFEHARRAFSALGLKWAEVNVDNTEDDIPF